MRLLFFVSLFLGIIYHYRDGLAYYFSFKTDKVLDQEASDKKLSDVRNYQVLEKNEDKAIGIDVSEYQGEIEWDDVETLDNDYEISFVFIRATVGNDRLDKRFAEIGSTPKRSILFEERIIIIVPMKIH